MKSSVVMFNVAAVIMCVGIALAFADLVRHKAEAPKRTVTFAPTRAATAAPTATSAPV